MVSARRIASAPWAAALLLIAGLSACGNDAAPSATAPTPAAPSSPAPTVSTPPPVTSSGAPVIQSVTDQHASAGTVYQFAPTLVQGGRVNWSKTYGPDALQVDPLTGAVTWSVPATLPSESFYVGVQASNAHGLAQQVWIVHVGVPAVVAIGPAETHQTLAAAFAATHAPGTTFVVRNGSYAGAANSITRLGNGSLQYPSAGTARAFTTVMAQDPGEVTLTGGAEISINGIGGPYGYVAFKGFFVTGTGTIGTVGYTNDQCSQASGCRPHHIKFTHNGVESAGEIPFNAFRSDDILFENNYAFGGGRYKFASYQANRIVMRRNLARYDRGNNEMAEPKGTYSIYTTMNALVTNNLAVDADQSRFVTQGQLAGEFTCPTTSGPSRVIMERNIQLNSEMLFGNLDHQAYGPCDAEIRDMVSWDIRPADVYVMSRAGTWFDHVTMGRVTPRADAVDQLFNGWPSNLVRGMTNSVLHEVNKGGLFYGFATGTAVLSERTVPRYGVDTVNISATPGTLNVNGSSLANLSSVDPLYSAANPLGGLRYLTRIEPGSALSGRAKDGGDLGATVMTFKGQSGTFWGEPGFDLETQAPMWPFPMEAVMAAKMAAYRYSGPTYSGPELARVLTGTDTLSGQRGFATTGQTLSHYVWGYLGHVVPPFNVHAGLEGGQVVVLWDPPPPATRASITGYNVYRVDGATRTKLNTSPVPGDRYSFETTQLPAGRTSTLVVTALQGSTESGSAYPARITLP